MITHFSKLLVPEKIRNSSLKRNLNEVIVINYKLLSIISFLTQHGAGQPVSKIFSGTSAVKLETVCNNINPSLQNICKLKPLPLVQRELNHGHAPCQ